METALYIEEIDGKPCLLLDSDIIECTRFYAGQRVLVAVNKDSIVIYSEDSSYG